MCLTLCDPMDCSPPGSFIHEIIQARLLERVAIPFSRWSSQSRDQTQVSCTAGRFFTVRATRETQKWWLYNVYCLWDLIPAMLKKFRGFIGLVEDKYDVQCWALCSLSLQGMRRKFKHVPGDTVTYNPLSAWQFIYLQCFEPELEFWGSQAAGWASHVALVLKNPPANPGEKRDAGSTPGLGRSPGGNGNPLQHSCLGNPMDRGAWRATVHGVAKSRTWPATKQQQQGAGCGGSKKAHWVRSGAFRAHCEFSSQESRTRRTFSLSDHNKRAVNPQLAKLPQSW